MAAKKTPKATSKADKTDQVEPKSATKKSPKSTKEIHNVGVIRRDGTGITTFPADVKAFKDAEADEVVENYSTVYDEDSTPTDTAGSRAGNPETEETP